jgi:hypothetical protein
MNNYMQKISRILFYAAFVIFILGFFSIKIWDPDFWWHLKTGEYIYQTASLPETDPFAYTSLSEDPVQPESKRIKFILNQYWLAQLVFYRTYHLFGFEGIILLRALILTLLVLLIYRSVRREGFGLYSSVILLIPVILLFRTFTGERPQLFSFLFAFLLLYLLEGFRKASVISQNVRPSNLNPVFYLLPLPFIILLWANLHGGFILGILIMFGYLFAENIKYILKKFGHVLHPRSLRQLNVTVVIALLASLVNPNGYNVIPFMFEFETGLYKSMIIESVSPVTLIRSGFYEQQFVIYFILLSFFALLFIIRGKKLDLTDGVILLGFSVMSLSASRFIPFFAPAAILMIARYSPGFVRKSAGAERLKSISARFDLPIAIILSILLVIVINNTDFFKSGIRENRFPEGAARFLKENKIAGNMFNPYVWGGYLIWNLYPEHKVFIDGRGLIGEVFFQASKVMSAYPKAVEGMPEWKAILRAYRVDFILTFSVDIFSGRLVPLVRALLIDPDWHLIYMDNISLIFLRESSENRSLIDRLELPKEWLWNEVAVEAALKAKDYGWNANFYITMGDALLAKKSYQEAKYAFMKAQRINPENDVVKRRLEFLRAFGY